MQLDNPFQILLEKLHSIEETLQELKSNQTAPAEAPEADLMSITQASGLLSLSKSTIYWLSSQSKIPVTKKGKRLYFSKKELLDWIKSGRRATIEEIDRLATNPQPEKRRAFRL